MTITAHRIDDCWTRSAYLIHAPLVDAPQRKEALTEIPIKDTRVCPRLSRNSRSSATRREKIISLMRAAGGEMLHQVQRVQLEMTSKADEAIETLLDEGRKE